MSVITLSAPSASYGISSTVSAAPSTLATSSSLTGNLSITGQVGFGVGSGVGQVQYIYQKDRNVTTGSPDILQLSAAGGLIDPDGNTLGFANIGAIVLRPAIGSTSPLTLASATSSTGVTWAQLQAATVATTGSAILLFDASASMPVVAGTGDKISVTTGSGTNTYTIEILGR